MTTQLGDWLKKKTLKKLRTFIVNCVGKTLKSDQKIISNHTNT